MSIVQAPASLAVHYYRTCGSDQRGEVSISAGPIRL